MRSTMVPGTPNGIAEKPPIPLSARIVAVADVYDALVSKTGIQTGAFHGYCAKYHCKGERGAILTRWLWKLF